VEVFDGSFRQQTPINAVRLPDNQAPKMIMLDHCNFNRWIEMQAVDGFQQTMAFDLLLNRDYYKLCKHQVDSGSV
jgi:hypothetical protein